MDEIIALPPFLALFVAGFMLVFLPRAGQRVILILAPCIALLSVFSMTPESIFPLNIAGTTVQLLTIQEYSMVFGLAMCLAMAAAGLFGFRDAKPKEMASALVVASGAVGIVFAGDLLSLLFFWEVLMCASVYLIYIGSTKNSEFAAWRYLMMHILGSTFLLAGIAGTIMDSGIAAFPALQLGWNCPHTATEWSSWLLLLGVMVNLAAPPFSAWLPDSYPAASPFGMVVLSSFTTKSALFVLMQIFAGSAPLIPIGLCMLLYGGLMALMQNQVRRHISYCIIAQLGVMVMAVGLGSEAALAGTAVLAFCHIGYNGLLTATSGSIIRQTGKFRLSDLGGLWKQMPITSGAIILGALSMAALPITGAFVGKHIISDALVAVEHPLYLFLFICGSSIATYLMFPWFALSGKSTLPKTKEVGLEVQFSYCIFAFLALAPGLYPGSLSFLIPHREGLLGYNLLSVLSQLLMITFAGAGFFMMLPWLKRQKGIILDMDWLYRVLIPHALKLLNQLYTLAERRVIQWYAICFSYAREQSFRLFSDAGTLTRPQPLGINAALIVAIFLVLLLILYL